MHCLHNFIHLFLACSQRTTPTTLAPRTLVPGGSRRRRACIFGVIVREQLHFTSSLIFHKSSTVSSFDTYCTDAMCVLESCYAPLYARCLRESSFQSHSRS